MTAEEFEELILSRIAARLRSGERAYDRGSKQVIESKLLTDLIQEAQEEIEDGMVYLAYLDVRLDYVKDVLRNRVVRPDPPKTVLLQSTSDMTHNAVSLAHPIKDAVLDRGGPT